MLTPAKAEIKGNDKIIALGDWPGDLGGGGGRRQCVANCRAAFSSFFFLELFSCDSKRQVNKHRQYCL